MHQISLGADLLERSSAEENLGALVDSKLANGIMGCMASKSREVIVPVSSASNGTRGSGQKMEHRKFHLNMTKRFYTLGVTE